MYDRNLQHFSPEGRLYQVWWCGGDGGRQADRQGKALRPRPTHPQHKPDTQVQYAERAAKRGSPVLALSNGRDALALCCERRRVSRLEDSAALEKLGEVQPPSSAPPAAPPGGGGASYLGFAGLAADGRRLLDKTRLFAERYRLRHGEAPGVRELALFIAGRSGSGSGSMPWVDALTTTKIPGG